MEFGIVGERLRELTLADSQMALWDMDKLQERFVTKHGEDSKEAIELRTLYFKYLAE